jgi:ABC-type polysaccharide/polyol phosphate export permease
LCFKENAALFFVVGIIRNISCGQSAKLLVLDPVVRIITTVRGKCAKACDCEGNIFIYFFVVAGVDWVQGVKGRE